jgi:preprotein translocase subunit SecG
MPILFLVLIAIACVLLGLIVLVQNPKGGGLSGAIGGFNSQFMGVKQTNDVLEKGTWLFAAIVGFLCIVSTLFFKGGVEGSGNNILQKVNPSSSSAPAKQQATPANTTQMPGTATPPPAGTPKKP